jgi:hypothetical protein
LPAAPGRTLTEGGRRLVLRLAGLAPILPTTVFQRLWHAMSVSGSHEASRSVACKTPRLEHEHPHRDGRQLRRSPPPFLPNCCPRGCFNQWRRTQHPHLLYRAATERQAPRPAPEPTSAGRGREVEACVSHAERRRDSVTAAIVAVCGLSPCGGPDVAGGGAKSVSSLQSRPATGCHGKSSLAATTPLMRCNALQRSGSRGSRGMLGYRLARPSSTSFTRHMKTPGTCMATGSMV